MFSFFRRFLRRPRHQHDNVPTLTEVEAALGISAAAWAGHCHEIATAIVDHGLVDGVAVYGDWLGDVSEQGHFRGHQGQPFIHHGWIVLRDGCVFDPTRWAFEGKAPYLYVGPSGDEYDEGGNGHRWLTMGPPPSMRPGDPIVSGERMSPHALAAILKLLGNPEVLTRPMVVWVANLPLGVLGNDAALVYNAIEELGYGALIPSDNLVFVARQVA